MPLLQHALWELWNRRHGLWIKAEEYQAFGGVKQAIASTAEEVYASCSDVEQERVRDIFLRLTRLDESGEGRDTRRRVLIEELIPVNSDSSVTIKLLNKLADARLIVKTDKDVEVAHEALIRHWERLRLWLNEDREGLQLRDHLSDSAHQWEQLGRASSELYRGARLKQLQNWMKKHNTELSTLEMEFMRTSQDAKRREHIGWSAIAAAGIVLLLGIILAQTGYINRFIYYPVDMENYWVTISAGEFQMGSSNKQLVEAKKLCPNCGFSVTEQPPHKVYLDAYQIGKYDITNNQYNQCVRAGMCTGVLLTNKLDHPVINVNWYQAKAYCEWVGGRLPTEAEWEKAARGGLQDKIYPWGDELPTCQKGAANGANFMDVGCLSDTMPVGSFAPNGFGLYDMSGNAYQWISDWYSDYQISPSRNPLGPDSGETKVLRGGSWFSQNYLLRTASRFWDAPTSTSADNFMMLYGFRCARNIP
jgi:formylglycine-generating enzyme required for sulfatase activity